MKKAHTLLAAAAFAAMLAPAAYAADLASDPNYKQCAGCHGANGEGKAAMKVAPLKDSASKSDDELAGVISKGMPPKMPAYGSKLSDDQIKALVAEIKALK